MYKTKIIISAQIKNYGAGMGTAQRETQRQESQAQDVSWNNMKLCSLPQSIMDAFPLVRKDLDKITEENAADN